MGIRNFILCGVLAAVGCGRNSATDAPAVNITPLPAIAPSTDYGKGVSALAAGEIGGVMTVAGGANFPDTPAAEGGKKRFYDDIFVLGEEGWTKAGTLPHPVAYGAAYAFDDRIIIAGGADVGSSSADVFEIRLSVSNCCNDDCDGLNGTLAIVTPMARLPLPVEQAAAAKEGSRLYLAGGLSDGTPSLGVYTIDTEHDGEWAKIAELPEPMVQPIAAVYGDRLYVWGGFDPAKKRAADYGFRYCDGEWRRIAGLPDGGTAVGSTAVQDENGMMLVVGGVNREVFDNALAMPAEKSREYLSQPVEYYRFRSEIYIFDPETESWSAPIVSTSAAARAGAAAVLSKTHGIVIIDGEAKPGIRSTDITAIEPL